MIRLALGKATIFSLLTTSGVGLLPSFHVQQAANRFVPDEKYTLRTDVRLVLLDVSVRDKAGAFVTGLSRDNFAVFENGHERPIKIFANDDVPATIGLLVDASGSMTPKRYEVLNAAQEFIRASNPRDEMFVLSFNDDVRRGLPEGTLFSSDLNKLRDALFRGKPAGKTALIDALIAGLDQLKLANKDRRELVLISDGGDNASEHNRQELLERIEQSMVTVHTIGLYEEGNPDRDPNLLRRVAKVSGGEAYFPTSPAEMTDICSRIAKDIRQRYVVGYAPADAPASEKHDKNKGDLRQIRFRVKSPGKSGLVARARTSYRYDDDVRSNNLPPTRDQQK